MAGSSTSGGPALRPAWATRLTPHPDYDNRRIVLADANTFMSVIGHGASKFELPGLNRWNNEMSWLFNSPFSEVTIKLNNQVYQELVGDNAAAHVPAASLKIQQDFVGTYRRNGKIILDRGNVPFFASRRQSMFQRVYEAFNNTNLEEPDQHIVADGIVNRIPIVTKDFRLVRSLHDALRNRLVGSVLESNKLERDLGSILIYP